MEDLFRINDFDSAALDAERKRILALLAEVVSAECTHEVGSTAVPGVVGKQDLDFLVLVPTQAFQATRSALDAQFRRNFEQLSNDEYQGYKVESEFDVAIQLTIEGGVYDTFLVFLSQLCKSAELRSEYNRLKRSFDGRAMAEYRDAKRAFIEQVLSTIAHE